MSYYSSVILSDSPQGYWRLDEASGVTAHDQTSNAYNGTLSGGVTLGQAGALSLDTDTAMLFNGTTGLITLAAGLSTNGWGALTVEAWVNLSNTSFGYTAFLVANDAPGTSHLGFELGMSTGNIFFRIGTGASFDTTGPAKTPTAGTWYHLVGVFTGTSLLVYVNGVQLGTTVSVASTTIAATANQVTFAAQPGVTTNSLPGTLDEVAIYNYALTPTQIANHYAAGTITQYPYTYGSFQIANHNGGLGYYLMGKDLDFPVYKPTLSPVARQDLWKINGWQLDQRQIQVDLVVVGSSRVDCIARLDTLFQALSLRDQQLVIHEDGRYWVANATTGKVKFAAGAGIVQAKVPITFICANPYAKAASSATPYDSGSLVYTASGSNYNSPIFTFPGGGTAYSWPQIHLAHQTPSQGSTSLTVALTQGQSQNAIFVSTTTFGASAGQILILYYSTGSPLFQLWSQKVVVSSTFLAGVSQINVNAFTAAYGFPSGAHVYVSTAWNQITISQLTDNYILSAVSTTAVPLPQTLGDYLDIYTDPSTGMIIATNGLSQYSDPVGAFPPLEPGNTQWQISIAADFAPTVDATWQWTPRFES